MTTTAETVTIHVNAWIDDIDPEDAKEEARRIEEIITKALRAAGYAGPVEADVETVDNSWPGEGAPGSCRCGSPTCTGQCPDCGMHETPLHGHNVHYAA